jgi:hypothetical protein
VEGGGRKIDGDFTRYPDPSPGLTFSAVPAGPIRASRPKSHIKQMDPAVLDLFSTDENGLGMLKGKNFRFVM